MSTHTSRFGILLVILLGVVIGAVRAGIIHQGSDDVTAAISTPQVEQSFFPVGP